MGLFMDTLEDNLERTGQYLDVLVLPSKPGDSRTFPPVPLLVHCPLCGEVVITENALKRHFIDKHTNRYVYLMADGKIIRDSFYIENKMNSLVAYLINIPSAEIRIEATSVAPVEMDFSENISIMDHLQEFHAGEINIAIYAPGGARQYNVYCGSLPEIRIEEIDRASSEHLFYPLNENVEPNWHLFKKSVSASGRHQLERQYADGLYEYAIGSYMVSNGKDGKDRLECALENLLPFRTTYAVTVQRVLALRMNLFRLLRMCMAPSRFAAANDFFNDQEKYLKREQAADVAEGCHDYGYAVYIDPFTEMLIDAIYAYYNEDYGLLDNLCGKLSLLCHGPDRNNRDKLHLLRARMALKKNHVIEAQSFYQMLIDNPAFNKEAKEILHGNSQNHKT